MEKFPRPARAVRPEAIVPAEPSEAEPDGSSEIIESPETPHSHYVEDVVAHARDLQQLCAEDPQAPGCRPELLHNEIEATELGELFRNYEANAIITLDDVTESVGRMSAYLERELGALDPAHEEAVFIAKHLALLKTRDQELKSAVRRYVNTLSSFFSVKKRRDQMDPEEFSDKIADIDKRRRAAHDALLETLRTYARIIGALREYGLLEDFSITPWGHGVDLSALREEPSDQRIFTFSARALQDRDFIKDWAVSSYLHDAIERVRAAQEKTPPEDPTAQP